MADQSEGYNDLVQPLFGDWKAEQDGIVSVGRGKSPLQRLPDFCLLFVDELAADLIVSGEVTDVGSAGHRLNGQLDTLGREKFGCRKCRYGHANVLL